MGAEILYSASELGFAYGASLPEALSVPRLELAAGSCVALVGPNGSGKTSLLKLLNGLLPGNLAGARLRGELRFRGESVCGEGRAWVPVSLRSRTIYLHQHPYILSGGLERNMAFACRAKGLVGREAEEASARALALVGLDSGSARGKRGLSGGEAQRLALARVIVSGAEVLLLDEPTASADAASRDLIAAALSRLAGEGKTIVFSAHGPGLIDALARRVIEFDRGEIVRDEGE